MDDNSSVGTLVARVCDGDQEAWNELIDRYSPLVWSICQRYQLTLRDVDDVSESVWLLLVENIASLRETAALPGWLATTTRNEVFRALRHAPMPASTAKDRHAQLMTFVIVLVWLMAILVPIVQQRLNAEGQLVTDAEVGTISLALAITALMKQGRK